MCSDTIRTRRSWLLALTSLLAAVVAGCAPGHPLDPPLDPTGGSGSSVPGAAPIDYHGFPYNLKAG